MSDCRAGPQPAAPIEDSRRTVTRTWRTYLEGRAMFYGALIAAALLLAHPLYVLFMATVLRKLGVPPDRIARWALRQAERQRLIDFVRSLRNVGTSEILGCTHACETEPAAEAGAPDPPSEG